MKKLVVLFLCLVSLSAFSIDMKKIANKVKEQVLDESQSYNLSIKSYLQDELSILNFLDRVKNINIEALSTEQLKDEFEIISTRFLIHQKNLRRSQSKKVIFKLSMIQKKIKA